MLPLVYEVVGQDQPLNSLHDLGRCVQDTYGSVPILWICTYSAMYIRWLLVATCIDTYILYGEFESDGSSRFSERGLPPQSRLDTNSDTCANVFLHRPK